jgi:starch-binding outer membrane protein, SusD/RagB family
MKSILPQIILLLSLFGCNEFLEVTPENQLIHEQVFTDRTNAYNALIGMYHSLQPDNYIRYINLASDDVKSITGYDEEIQIDSNYIQTDNSYVENIWTTCYASILAANMIINNMDNVPDMGPSEKNQWRGEACFARAYNHFNLLQFFGQVPYVTSSVTSFDEIEYPLQETKEKLYELILNDLDSAIALIPADFLADGWITYWAAVAFKARVSIFTEDWPMAMKSADEVIKSGLFTLEESYKDIFDYKNPYSSEGIFEVDFDDQNWNTFSLDYLSQEFGGWYIYGPDAEIITAYEPSDARFQFNLHNIDGEKYFISKYNDAVTLSDNIMVLRLAEMYIIRAEAALHGANYPGEGSALDDINIIRQRAGVTPLTSITLDDILNERRLEFAFEGHRWFDLKRTGRAMEFMPFVRSEENLTWPIPQSEIDLNPNLVQNPGY